jgi:hypothetical protein
VRGQLMEFGRFGLSLQAGNRFSNKIIGHRDARGERTTTVESKLSFTTQFRIRPVILAEALLRRVFQQM